MEEKKKSKNQIIIIIIIVLTVIATIIGIVVFISNKATLLTQENYTDYLKISTPVNGGEQYTIHLGTDFKTNYVSKEDFFQNIVMSVNVSGTSDNFIYEEVEVEVRFVGDCPLYQLVKAGSYNSRMAIISPVFSKTGEVTHIDKTLTVKCDVSGNIKSSKENSYTEEIPKKEDKNNYISKEDISKIEKEIKVKGKVKANK